MNSFHKFSIAARAGEEKDGFFSLFDRLLTGKQELLVSW